MTVAMRIGSQFRLVAATNRWGLVLKTNQLCRMTELWEDQLGRRCGQEEEEGGGKGRGGGVFMNESKEGWGEKTKNKKTARAHLILSRDRTRGLSNVPVGVHLRFQGAKLDVVFV